MHSAYTQVLESLYFLVRIAHHSRDDHNLLYNPRRVHMNDHMYSRDSNRRTLI